MLKELKGDDRYELRNNELIDMSSPIIRDYVEKKQDYERFGVREYWIIDPQNKFIQVFHLEGNKFKTYSSEDGEEHLKAMSSVLTGFEINWPDLFGSAK